MSGIKKTNLFADKQRELLNKCVVRFQFQKADGTVSSEKVGTTNLKFIPEAKHPKNQPNDKVISYYDLEVGDWRSMQADAQFIHLKSWKSVPKEYAANAK